MHKPISQVLESEGITGLSLSQVEELNRLGDLQQIYRPDPSSRGRNRRLLWVGFTVFLLLGLLLLTTSVLPTPQGVRPLSLPQTILFALFIGCFLVACGWRLRQVGKGNRVRILVFEQGLARLEGESLVTCRWDQIESVEGMVKTYHVEFVPVGSRFIITLRFGDNEMRVDGAKEHLAGMDGLYQRICRETSRYLLPRLQAEIEAGKTVKFGVLAISKSGLHWGKYVLAWNDAKNLELKDGVRVRNPNTWPLHPWVRLVDFRLPNHLVFLLLAEHYLKQNRREPLAPEPNQLLH